MKDHILGSVGSSTPEKMRAVAAWIREGQAKGSVREPDPADIEKWADEIEAPRGTTEVRLGDLIPVPLPMKVSGGNMTNAELSERLRKSPDWHSGEEIASDIDFNKPPAHQDGANTDHPYCPRPEDPGGDCACGLPIGDHDPPQHYVPADWTPTPENINALPTPLRKYIHDLETRCDPAGETRARVIAEDTARWAYEKGWREGGEAMRKAIIEEVSQ